MVATPVMVFAQFTEHSNLTTALSLASHLATSTLCPSLRSIALALLLLFQLAAHAAPMLANYAHTAWNGQRGAPADVVQFTQTPDGWLWISSPNGLFRFDGVDCQADC